MSQAEHVQEHSQEEFEAGIDSVMETSKMILMLMDVNKLNAMKQALACIGALASIVISSPDVVDPLITFLRKMTENLKKDGVKGSNAFEDLIKGVKLDELLNSPLEIKDPEVELGTIRVEGRPLFELGMVEVYAGVRDVMKPSYLLKVLGKYLAGDWGPYVDAEDGAINLQHAKDKSGKIFAVHKVNPDKDLSDDNKFYLITNGEQTETKAMMPEEYNGE